MATLSDSSITALGEAGAETSSAWAELWAVHVVVDFDFEGEMARCVTVYWLKGQASRFAGCSGTWKEHN